uniref:Uncharacterized protein n=1 Tax=Arundo donax TaxID=35708 RepID=A0A0A9ETI7_ARUDO
MNQDIALLRPQLCSYYPQPVAIFI